MRVWLVTGASRGLGATLVEALLAHGDAVVATARSTEAITERFGAHPMLLPVRLDVTDEEQARAAVAAALDKFGRLDVLVNNAGYGVLGAVEEVSAAEVEALYRTNVFGLLNVTRAVLPAMRAQRSGHILNLSSLGGYSATYGWGIYHSSKFAVEGISEALAQEVAPLGIRVTIVEPSYFRTEFMTGGSLNVTAACIEDYAETSGLARAQAADVAGALAEPTAGAEPGGNDPQKFAQALIAVSESDTPPLRLPLGQSALDRIAQKHAQVDGDVAAWRTLCLLG